MITKDYISFETTKLLKEKRFDENAPVNYFVGDDKHRICISTQTNEMIPYTAMGKPLTYEKAFEVAIKYYFETLT